MTPPSRTGLWTVIESLQGLDLIRVEAGGQLYVEVVDTRTWTVLVSLTAADATALAARLVTVAGRAELPVADDSGRVVSGTTFGRVELPPPVEVDDRAP